MRWTALIEKYRKITNIVGTIIIAWLLSAIVGEMAAVVLAGSSSPLPKANANQLARSSLLSRRSSEQMVAYYMPICERNIFDSEKRSPCTDEPVIVEELKEPEPDPGAKPVKSDIAATLVGTMVSTVPEASFATIKLKAKNETNNYRLDDKILGEAKVYDIQRNEVYFIRNGRREYLETERPKVFSSTAAVASRVKTPTDQGIKKDGDKITVARSKVESELANLNKIIQQARMVPNYKDGKVNGFKVFAIRNGSIFQQLGLKNGDIIHRINGTDIDSVEKAIPMLQLARSESNINIDMSRRGSKKTLSIEIQ